MQVARSYVGGRWVESDGDVTVSDPYSGREIAVVSLARRWISSTRPLGRRQSASRTMAEMPGHARAAMLGRVTDELARRADALATSMVLQAGRALKDCRAEVERSVVTMGLCAEEAKRISGEVIPIDAVPSGVGKIGFTLRVPVGVVAAIFPFNTPLEPRLPQGGPCAGRRQHGHPQGST